MLGFVPTSLKRIIHKKQNKSMYTHNQTHSRLFLPDNQIYMAIKIAISGVWHIFSKQQYLNFIKVKNIVIFPTSAVFSNYMLDILPLWLHFSCFFVIYFTVLLISCHGKAIVLCFSFFLCFSFYVFSCVLLSVHPSIPPSLYFCVISLSALLHPLFLLWLTHW